MFPETSFAFRITAAGLEIEAPKVCLTLAPVRSFHSFDCC
jgi:hypothetical protein